MIHELTLAKEIKKFQKMRQENHLVGGKNGFPQNQLIFLPYFMEFFRKIHFDLVQAV